MLGRRRGGRSPDGHGQRRQAASYNVQTAVDADTGLVLHHEVTDEATDNRMLHPMAEATREVLERDGLTVVADAGYSNGAQASACEADAIMACVPANRAINNQGDETLLRPHRLRLRGRQRQLPLPGGPKARA